MLCLHYFHAPHQFWNSYSVASARSIFSSYSNNAKAITPNWLKLGKNETLWSLFQCILLYIMNPKFVLLWQLLGNRYPLIPVGKKTIVPHVKSVLRLCKNGYVPIPPLCSHLSFPWFLISCCHPHIARNLVVLRLKKIQHAWLKFVITFQK
eukprot:jgi/Bigna1/61810/fgenesh1_kg.26_\